MTRNIELKKNAAAIRHSIIESIYAAGSGHPGGSLSAADILTYLYFEEMNIDPGRPEDPLRDRFVLSKGHAAPALYAALARRGYFDPELLHTLRRKGSRLQGHPDMKKVPGVDMSSGSLGQGLSAAAGMALAARLSKEYWQVYVLLGDGELQEGQIWEAVMFACSKGLDNLTIIVDCNGLQIDGAVDAVLGPARSQEKFAAFGCEVIAADGHDFDTLRAAFAKERTGKVRAILCRTVKGKGISFMENQAVWHGKALNAQQYETAMKELDAIEEKLNV